MFKKHVLAVAVMALTSGVAFADNEAVIEQTNTALVGSSVSVIEQVYDTANVNTTFAHIIQNNAVGAADTFNVVVYQDVATEAAAVDSAGQTSINTVSNTTFDATSAPFANTAATAYETLNGTVANFALVNQDATDGSQAVIAQLSVDQAIAFTNAGTLFGADLLLGVAATAGLADGGSLTVDGNIILIDAGTASTFLTGDTTTNGNNIAAVAQGSAVVNRAGDALGVAAASIDDTAIIVQLGTDNFAQVLQAGSSLQVAVVIQADTGNDAFVAQYDGSANTATVVQLAVNDIATVYQSGNGNVATIYQRQ